MTTRTMIGIEWLACRQCYLVMELGTQPIMAIARVAGRTGIAVLSRQPFDLKRKLFRWEESRPGLTRRVLSSHSF